MYRKEKCRRLLERVAAPPPTRPKEEEDDESQSHLQKFELLWSVAELDRKWMALRQRKRRLEKAYKTHIMPSIERGSENAKQWSRVLSVRSFNGLMLRTLIPLGRSTVVVRCKTW